MNPLVWLARVVGFLLWYSRELIVGTVRVLTAALGPTGRGRGIMAHVPTRCRTRVEITLLAVAWTLTPGTLVLALRRDAATGRWSMGVHDLFASPEQAQRGVEELENRLLPLMAPRTWKERTW